MSHSKHPRVSGFMLSMQAAGPPKVAGGLNKLGVQDKWGAIHISLCATGTPGYQKGQISFSNG